jgi:hypothetical protein
VRAGLAALQGGRFIRQGNRDPIRITLKSCNRCARYLPVNVGGPGNEFERYHLSFSNHCTADHLRLCRHSSFGHLREDGGGATLRLEYGFQLECRYCKKFTVNAAHNPQRTAAQMKEDAARRRGFELLLEALYEGAPQLRYRHRTGRELADDVIAKFVGHCFRCGRDLRRTRGWHLDHTRPLALLWPLDVSATLLCGSCNSEKGNRPPAQFYTPDELVRLAEVTALPLEVLKDPAPNADALDRLMGRLDWFFGEFLRSPEMVQVRDGKVAGELLIKALQKVMGRCEGHSDPNLRELYDSRRSTD